MPFNVKRTAVIEDREILRSGAGLDSIKSMVVDSTKIVENPASSGRYIVYAGTVFGKINGSTKVCPISAGLFGSGASGAWVAADIVGISQRPLEFFLGPGITAGAATDEPVALLHLGAEFNINNLSGYTGNETVTKAGLPFCMFR